MRCLLTSGEKTQQLLGCVSERRLHKFPTVEGSYPVHTSRPFLAVARPPPFEAGPRASALGRQQRGGGTVLGGN